MTFPAIHRTAAFHKRIIPSLIDVKIAVKIAP